MSHKHFMPSVNQWPWACMYMPLYLLWNKPMCYFTPWPFVFIVQHGQRPPGQRPPGQRPLPLYGKERAVRILQCILVTLTDYFLRHSEQQSGPHHFHRELRRRSVPHRCFERKQWKANLWSWHPHHWWCSLIWSQLTRLQWWKISRNAGHRWKSKLFESKYVAVYWSLPSYVKTHTIIGLKCFCNLELNAMVLKSFKGHTGSKLPIQELHQI